MEIINIKNNDLFLNEYISLCQKEWGSPKSKHGIKEYLNKKKEQILTEDKVISILGLVDNDILIGFISLFKYDGDEKRELTPWYATMYIKEAYRNNGYSKILNDAILNKASKLGYYRVYLKTNLKNYYEKFGAKYIQKLTNGESLYYIDLLNKSFML